MVEDMPEDEGPALDSGRAKRAPPTIDLEASEVSGETRKAGDDARPERISGEQSSEAPSSREPPARAISAWVIAVVSGAVAAALVIGVGWMLGWPAVPATPAATEINAAVIGDLGARVAAVESKTNKPATSAPDPASAARIEALEKSIASLRGELAGARAQSENLAAALNDVKTTPRDSSAPLDLTDINARIAGLESATRAQSAEAVQQNAKLADDVPLRRVVASALLDVLVRIGEPYPAAPAAEKATTGSGLVERLQAGAAKLVRIERTDTAGNDRGAVVARATAAALRNEFNEARRELNTLAPADRAAAQAWLDKCDARDAALAASRQFAAEAMAALAKPAP